jgi:hyperosmotically inducible periplasmic protein
MPVGHEVKGLPVQVLHTNRVVVNLCLMVAACLFSACDRKDNGLTPGQKVDEVMKNAERKSDEIKADAKAVGKEIQQDAADLADRAALKTKDLAITTQVNAQLARDERLSTMSINVDTAEGRVLLKGTAPDEASRERAATLAKAVDGVVSVNNELTVRPAK